MMTDDDKKYATVVDKDTLFINFTTKKGQIPTLVSHARSLACRHFYDSSSGLIKDRGGIFLAGNTLNVYHVASICEKTFIVSKDRLTPLETRPIAAAYMACGH